MQGPHRLCESGELERSCGVRNSPMMQGQSAKPEYAATLRDCLDDIWPLLVFSETVYDNCAAVGKHSLYRSSPLPHGHSF